MSPNITLSWVLALAPEIGLLVVLFMVLVFDKLFKPADRRQVGTWPRIGPTPPAGTRQAHRLWRPIPN